MRYLSELVVGLPVEEILAEIEQNPQLWNRHTLRTAGYAPAHNEVSDIWVRYRDIGELAGLRSFCSEAEAVARFVGEPHESRWYPDTEKLKHLRECVFELMRYFRVERLGGLLITRIPPSGEVGKHVDYGWHAGYYQKVAVQLMSAPGQAFCFEDGEYECDPGSVYTFDNSQPHWVKNPTDQPRMTLICCFRTDRNLLTGGRV